MRKVSIFLLLALLACSKKSKSPQEPQNPTLSNYEIALYWGYGLGKTHKYYAIDTFNLTVPNLTDTTISSEDTILRVIEDTIGDLNIVFYDSSYTAQIKLYDTLYVYNPFIVDTIRSFNLFNNSSQIAIANKVFKAPLSINESWTPIEPQSKAINDTVKISVQQLGNCTLWVYIDTLKVDSSNKLVVEAGSDSSFKLLSKTYYRVKYRYQTKPQTQICSDTTIKNENANSISLDTTYLKNYLGITKTYRFDSTTAQFQVGLLLIQTIYKYYGRRVRVQ